MLPSESQPQEENQQASVSLNEALAARFLTLPQAEQVLNISYQLIYDMVKAKKWPSISIGRRHLIPYSFILRLEEEAYGRVQS